MRNPLGPLWEAVRKVAVVEEKINTLTPAIESEHAERQRFHDRLNAKIEREIERERDDRQRAENATVNRIGRLEEQMSSVQDRLTRLETSREVHEREMNARHNQMDANFKLLQAEVKLGFDQLQAVPIHTPALTEPQEKN